MPPVHRLAFVALLLVACGAAPAQAQTLSLAYHTSDTYRYSFHSTAKQTLVTGGLTFPTDIEMTAAESVKVNSVDSSGIADLTLTVSNFVLKSATEGLTNTTTGMPAFTIDVKVAADGRVLSMDGNKAAAGNPFLAFTGAGGGFFITAVLPSTAVKPGDTWTKDYSQAVPGGSGGIQVTSRSKYLRNESLGGVNAAVVETTSNGSIDMNLGTPPAGTGNGGFGGISMRGSTTSVVTTWIDPSGHRILKSRSTSTNDGTMNLGSNVNLGGMSGTTTIKGTGTTDLTPA